MKLHGSSPRVRGKQIKEKSRNFNEGLIPACAGKTFWPAMGLIVLCGSSPRVRGKRPRLRSCTHCPGLIPACAGKTSERSRSLRRSRAHPRVCGENFIPRPRAAPFGGSSPRVRGKLHGALDETSYSGLIPACAGKTQSERSHLGALWAHPRVCGENAISTAVGSAVKGSSPRVRGKQRPANEVGRRVGLIPACAGKTPLKTLIRTS